MRKRIRGWLQRLNYKYLAVAGLLLAAVFIVYFWHLSTVGQGLSPAEANARTNSASWHAIAANPVNAPQHLLQYAAQKAGYHGAFSMRLASVIFAILFVGCTFWLMKTWFGLTIGVFSSLVFATTPLVVLLARSASGDIMLLTPAALLAAYIWLSRRQRKYNPAWLCLVLACGLGIYTPGIFWLILIGLIVLRKRIIELAHSVSRKVLLVSLCLIILLMTPFVWALVKDFALFHQLLLIPAHWSGVLETAKSIGWAALALVWRTPTHNALIIGRLPILDVIQISLIVFGAYVMWSRARREMAVLLAMIVAAIIFSGINNDLLLLALCLPALAILSGAGLRYLYNEWRSIFPRNPLPLSFALIIIAALVGLQVAYGLRYSLVAWPHTTATKQLYVIK